MTRGRVVRLGSLLALGLLLFTGVAGIYNGFNELPDSATPLQRAVSIGVLLYGILGLGAAGAVIARVPWSVAVVAAWGVAITLVATVAPIAYGGPDVPLAGALLGGVIVAVIALGVVWLVRRRVSPPPSTE